MIWVKLRQGFAALFRGSAAILAGAAAERRTLEHLAALYLAFRRRFPVIGLSRSDSDTGAAAALITAMDNIGGQAIEGLDTYFSIPHFCHRDSQPPHFITIAINSFMVRTPGLEELGEQLLHQRVLVTTRGLAP